MTPKEGNTLLLQVSPSSVFIYILKFSNESSELVYANTHIISENEREESLVSRILNGLPSEMKNIISSVRILCNSLSSSFIPQEIFSQKNARDYLSYNCLLEDKKETLTDTLPNQSMMNVYQVDSLSLEKELNKHFKLVSSEHYASALWTEIYHLVSKSLYTTGYGIFLDTTLKNAFRIIITKKGKLFIHNVFEYDCVESFTYYIMSILQEFYKDPEIAVVSELKSFSKKHSLEVQQLKSYGIKANIVDLSRNILCKRDILQSVTGLVLMPSV